MVSALLSFLDFLHDFIISFPVQAVKILSGYL